MEAKAFEYCLKSAKLAQKFIEMAKQLRPTSKLFVESKIYACSNFLDYRSYLWCSTSNSVAEYSNYWEMKQVEVI